MTQSWKCTKTGFLPRRQKSCTRTPRLFCPAPDCHNSRSCLEQGCCLLARFALYLTLVLGAFAFLVPSAHAGDLCKNTALQAEWDKLPNSNAQSWAVVDNALFQSGHSPRARIEACLRNAEFNDLLGNHGSPFRFITKVHVNGITYCPSGG